MGNSSTSRYADGRDLYHPDALADLRRLASRREAATDLRQAADALARDRLRNSHWQALRASIKQAPQPQLVGARRGGGEAARLLLDPDAGPHLRRLARRHKLDEGDVAGLWASLIAETPGMELRDFGAEAAPA